MTAAHEGGGGRVTAAGGRAHEGGWVGGWEKAM